jgi:ribose transport system permease protein
MDDGQVMTGVGGVARPLGGVSGSRVLILDLIRRVIPFIALIAMVIYFASKSSAFYSTANITLMTGAAGTLLLVALGSTLVVVAGSVDLSVGSTVLLTGALVASFINDHGANMVNVILLTVGIGVGVGLLNGVVFAYGRVPSFITTLGSLSLVAGLGATVLKGQSISYGAPNIENLANGQWIPHVQNSAVIAAGAFIIVWFLARRTRFGLYVYAMGGNESVVLLSGVNVRLVKVMLMILAAVTAALAGLLLSAQLSSGSPSLGSNSLLDSIAAIVVGGTALSGGIGGVERTLLGVLILTVLSDGLDQTGVQPYTQTIAKGAVIIVAAVFTMGSQRKFVIK